MKKILASVSAIAICVLLSTGSAHAGEPTCSDKLPLENHGQHIVGDYVTGLGGIGGGIWPFIRGTVGNAIAAIGAIVPGGPGPGFHFPNGFAPGASFCTDSHSPGVHL